MDMNNYKVTLKDLETGEVVSRTFLDWTPDFALCRAMDLPPWYEYIQEAQMAAGVNAEKPPNQRLQLVSIECLDEAGCDPERFFVTRAEG